MSCQQASRIITTINASNSNNHSQSHNNANDSTSNCNNSNSNISSTNLSRIVSTEDPYVFTESVPTTPPILFNTQKTRPRLSDIKSSKTLSFPNVRQAKVSLTNGKIAEIPSHSVTTASGNTLKNGIATSTAVASIQTKKPANVCIVRPQLQQQQQHHHQHQHVISSSPCLERELKSISPPPLYTPTPSLWQTPLLIEATPAKTMSTITPAPPLPTLVATQGVNVSGGGGGVSNASSTPNTTITSTTTTAMAKVAPIVVQPATPPSPPPPSCLPPSKFHSHTLAQHLQKVECLKKPKKSVQPLGAVTPLATDLEKSESYDNEAKMINHSAQEELNDIPVNVIFRMAMVSQQHSASMDVENTKLNFENDHLSLEDPISSPETRSINGNQTVVTPSTTPASKSMHIHRKQPEINPSSRQSQQQPPQQDHPQQQQQQHAMDHSESPSELLKSLAKSKIPNSKPRKSSTLKSFKTSAMNVNSYDHLTIDCSTPKGAVAILKMSHRLTEADESDISYLATPAGLPYCIQNYWMTSYDIRNRLMDDEKSRMNRSCVREERIVLYKQQLRRQAMQLLNTRSLQRLPMQMARRRLVCVDRLLRKYHKQNENGLSANVKRCCAKDCKAFTLEMSSYCQQHIALNAGQAIFLACTAKFADNTQCRVPVFDITHDLPLCLEHARKRDAYNRFAYEQRPRKMQATSFNPERLEVKVIKAKHHKLPMATKRAEQQLSGCGRKRKSTGNPVGRPQKRAKKCSETSVTPLPTKTLIKRKNSTTSLESLASNSQHSTASSTVHYPQQTQQFYATIPSAASASPLPPPALAPLSTGFLTHQSLPQHLFSFGHDNYMNGHLKKHSTGSIITPTLSSPTKDNKGTTMANVSLQKMPCIVSANVHLESSDSSFLNTNSNSNFTSSGMGSTTSLPTADDFLTQDMLSMCENSSVSSVDTGLGGLSDPELMLGGADGDDIPLGDTHLLEEQDLANVLSSLPEDAFKELFSTVHQDESDEIERAIELADKNLKTLQQTIGTDLGDFLDFSDDMLLNNGDICSAASQQIMDASAMYHLGAEGGMTIPNTTMMATNNNISTTTSQDIRGLVHT